MFKKLHLTIFLFGSVVILFFLFLLKSFSCFFFFADFWFVFWGSGSRVIMGLGGFRVMTGGEKLQRVM